jgi:hypothetical protein
MEGFGWEINDYITLCVGLISPRIIEFSDGKTIISNKGIMMGEPLAKPTLTLLNLCIEEIAYLKFLGKENILHSTKPAPNRDWRYVHIGGDDHLVFGPPSYLDLITDIHIKSGSRISPGQHGRSKIAVKYTERVINITNLVHRKVVDSDNYSNSLIVDSVKVRLMEIGPWGGKDNKNVAIGKSKQFIGTLTWLPDDPVYWPMTKKISIRDLFIERMGVYIPSRKLHPKLFASVLLPQELGGYGLGLPHEYMEAYLGSPKPTRGLINKALSGLDIRKERKYFSILNSNVAVRGCEKLTNLIETMKGQLNDYPSMVEGKTLYRLTTEIPEISEMDARRKVAYLASKNIFSFSEYVKMATRGNLFQELIMGKVDLSMYNTRAYFETYRSLWKKVEDETDLLEWGDFILPCTSVEISKLVKDQEYYFDIKQNTATDFGPDIEGIEFDDEIYHFGESDYLQKYSRCLPDLNIGTEFILKTRDRYDLSDS